jgi:hypothetical protein
MLFHFGWFDKRAEAAQVRRSEGTSISQRQRDNAHFGWSVNHSNAYCSPRFRQALNGSSGNGRSSVHEPGADWRQNTSTSTVMSVPFAAGVASMRRRLGRK